MSLTNLACIRARVDTGTENLRPWAAHDRHVGTNGHRASERHERKEKVRRAGKGKEKRKAKAKETPVKRRRNRGPTIPILPEGADAVACGVTRELTAGC